MVVSTITKDLNLSHPDNRICTFATLKWIYGENVPCSPTSMAQAGFYAISSDCAVCYYCQKQLEGWEAHDVPWEEHKSHSPECPLLKIYSSSPEQVPILDAMKLERERLLYNMKMFCENIRVSVQESQINPGAANGKRGGNVGRKKK